MNGKVRQASLICIAALLYSTLFTSFFHHHGFSYRSGCGICKITAESCDAADIVPFRTVKPFFIPLYSCADPSPQVVVPASSGLIARAPPAADLPG